MATVFDFELPNELDLSESDQSQTEDVAVCETLAESSETEGESSETESGEVGSDAEEEWSGDDVVEITKTAEPILAEPQVKRPAQDAHQAASTQPHWNVTAVTEYYDDQSDLIEQIREATAECRRAASRIDSIKAEMKEAKGAHEKALLDLQQLCSELIEPKQLKPWRSDFKPSALQSTMLDVPLSTTPASCESQQIAEPIAVPDAEPAASSTRDTDQDDIAWRSVPITELNLESIKGLGEKKRGDLVDLCPTIGALEDLRARVGRDAASLPELMPKGIGRSACDQLEELLLTWLAGRLGRSESSATPAAAESVAAAQQPATSGATPESDSHADQVARRAVELDDGKPSCLACKQKDDGIWKSGYRASEDDASIWECPWTAGDNQDEWIRGFLAQKAIGVYDRNQADRGNDLDEL